MREEKNDVEGEGKYEVKMRGEERDYILGGIWTRDINTFSIFNPEPGLFSGFTNKHLYTNNH